jgi:hypothetical protein
MELQVSVGKPKYVFTKLGQNLHYFGALESSLDLQRMFISLAVDACVCYCWCR